MALETMTGEHKPWVGEAYHTQPAGSKMLIVGFSHHGRYDDDVDDHPDFTNRTVRHAAAEGIRFFDDIAGYFGAGRDFWSRVAFANTLGTTVGDEMYSEGTPEQRAAAPARIGALVEELTPDLVFVFSTKAWPLMPPSTGTSKDAAIEVDGFGPVKCRTYAAGDGNVIAYGFRHPLFAPGTMMRAQVAAALASTQPA